MLGDHLRTCWRDAVNSKLTTSINIGGLAIGLAVFFALTFYVQREFSWDAQWKDADNIYVVAGRQESTSGSTAPLLYFSFHVVGTHLKTQYPDAFEAYARILRVSGELMIDEERYPNRQLSYAEPDLLDVIQIESVAGSIEEIFADPSGIAISAKAAETLFGSESPIGRTLTFNSQTTGPTDFTIKAVFRIPAPSSLAFMDFVALFDSSAGTPLYRGVDSWGNADIPAMNTDNYFKLRPGHSAGQMEAELRKFMDDNNYFQSPGGKTRFVFMPLRDVHLQPTLFDPVGIVARLRVMAAVAAIVLLISGCNFVMLATLRSIDRIREIGLRRTVGGEPLQLMTQHLVSVFVQTLTAALIALALLEVLLPWIRTQLNVGLEIDLWTWQRIGQCVLVVVAFTLLSGIYPALLLVRGRPATLLKSTASRVASSGGTLRKMLVGLQFALVIGLLLASAVVREQIDYTRNRDRGYDLENFLGFRLGRDTIEKSPLIVSEFNRVPGVVAAALGGVSPGTIMIGNPPRVMGVGPDGTLTEAPVQQVGAGVNYFKVMSIPVVAGREFLPELEGVLPVSEDPDVDSSADTVILNVAASKALGFPTPEDALNATILMYVAQSSEIGPSTKRVVGVVADTQFSSLMLPPIAQMFRYSHKDSFIGVRLDPDVDQTKVTEALGEVWNQVVGNRPFLALTATTLEGNLLYQEELEASIVTGSAGLALLIALMGLYGLVEATVAKRTKEIGVRKVMGADNLRIVALLLWQFSKPIIVANVIAWPIAMWGLSRWLQRFPYQLDTTVIVVSAVFASIVALSIAWLTISVMAGRAAAAKPVSALRYE